MKFMIKSIIYMSLSFFISCGGSSNGNKDFKILSTKPENLQKDVKLDTDIKIIFNKDISKDTSKYIFSIKDKNNNAIDVDIIPSTDTLILIPKPKLKASMKYDITISKASSKDNKEINTSYEFSFTTMIATVADPTTSDNNNEPKQDASKKEDKKDKSKEKDINENDTIEDYACRLSPGGNCDDL